MTAFLLLAQSSFSDINEPDWTVNIILWGVLLIGLGATVLWRTRAFEAAVDAAAAGQAVSVRAAYSQFWVVVALATAAAVGLGGAALFFDVKKLFIAG